MTERSPDEKKTLWENEKLLVTSNFSFFYCVFKILVQRARKNQGFLGKGLTKITPPHGDESLPNRFGTSKIFHFKMIHLNYAETYGAMKACNVLP